MMSDKTITESLLKKDLENLQKLHEVKENSSKETGKLQTPSAERDVTK
jgi:hypothetical protein